jgi:hypothetical protein
VPQLAHVLRDLPLLWAGTSHTSGCLLPQVHVHALFQARLTGQTARILALVSANFGVNCKLGHISLLSVKAAGATWSGNFFEALALFLVSLLSCFHMVLVLTRFMMESESPWNSFSNLHKRSLRSFRGILRHYQKAVSSKCSSKHQIGALTKAI